MKTTLGWQDVTLPYPGIECLRSQFVSIVKVVHIVRVDILFAHA
jgi:hypothetical protein